MLIRAWIVVQLVLLLQPPGYCLCRLGAAALRPSASSEVASPAPEDAPRKPCPCCAHEEEGPSPDASAQLTEPTTRPDHLPGCPVSPTAALDRPAPIEPPAPPLHDLALLLGPPDHALASLTRPLPSHHGPPALGPFSPLRC